MVQLIPAIDLMNGKIVRLTRGEAKTAKFYDKFGTPAEAAERWSHEGAGKLHIIDLDAAFGNGNNLPTIEEISMKYSEKGHKIVPIQVGGGIRNFDIAAKLFNMGVSQVILGTLAFKQSLEMHKIKKIYGSESVIVSLDHENGWVKTHGWTNLKSDIQTDTSDDRKKATRKEITIVRKISVKNALEKFTEMGVCRFLITSIAQDGMLSGPDLKTLSAAVEFPGAKIIAAGGIGSINHLIALKNIGVEGAVIGKALYEGRFTLKEAIEKVGA